MSLSLAALSSRRLIRVSGPDAVSFLQGLVSNDVERVSPGHAVFAALASPQGKLLYDFIVLDDRGDGLLLDVEAARADELIKKLNLYRLRAKVTIEPSDLSVYAAFGWETDIYDFTTKNGVLTITDPRDERLGYRLYGNDEKISKFRAPIIKETDESEYTAHRLALGIPEGASEFGEEKLFLLEANFEALHGVDFKKGCYIGQELTARMKHKTELKKRLLPLQVEGSAEAGAAVTAAGREIGTVIGARGETGFALIRLDRLAESGSDNLKAGEAPARLARIAYLENAS